MKKINTSLTDRETAIIAMRNSGATYKAIGEKFEISASRVQQIYEKSLRKIKKAEKKSVEAIKKIEPVKYQPTAEDIAVDDLKMSARTTRILRVHEINTLKDLRETPIEKLTSFNNMGVKSVTEIVETLFKIKNKAPEI